MAKAHRSGGVVGSNPASSIESLSVKLEKINLLLRRKLMFRIAAVKKDKDGAVVTVVVDVETAIGKSPEAARMAFTIKHAEELDGKEVELIVHPF